MITMVDPIGPTQLPVPMAPLDPILGWLALLTAVGVAVVVALIVRAERATRPGSPHPRNALREAA